MQNHRSQRCLTPLVARNAEYRSLTHSRVLHDDFLDVLREHIDATADDHVFLSVHEVEKSIFINVPQVSGVQPAFDNRLSSQIRLFVIAGHQGGATAHNLPDLSGSGVFALLSNDSHLKERLGRTDRSWFRRVVILVENGHESFRQPVKFIEPARQAAIQLLLMLQVQRSTDGPDHFE